jgi:hypothetical protein
VAVVLARLLGLVVTAVQGAAVVVYFPVLAVDKQHLMAAALTIMVEMAVLQVVLVQVPLELAAAAAAGVLQVAMVTAALEAQVAQLSLVQLSQHTQTTAQFTDR